MRVVLIQLNFRELFLVVDRVLFSFFFANIYSWWAYCEDVIKHSLTLSNRLMKIIWRTNKCSAPVSIVKEKMNGVSPHFLISWRTTWIYIISLTSPNCSCWPCRTCALDWANEKMIENRKCIVKRVEREKRNEKRNNSTNDTPQENSQFFLWLSHQ